MTNLRDAVVLGVCRPPAGHGACPCAFPKPQHVAICGSMEHSQGLRQTGGNDCLGTLHLLTTATKIALELSTTALGNREGYSALSLYYRPGLG